jgi:hypothetical protein
MLAIKVGDTVKARYYENIVTGKVTAVRAHTIRFDTRETTLEFDNPVQLTMGGAPFGQPRSRLLIHDDWDGGVSTYNDNSSCVLEVIPQS